MPSGPPYHLFRPLSWEYDYPTFARGRQIRNNLVKNIKTELFSQFLARQDQTSIHDIVNFRRYKLLLTKVTNGIRNFWRRFDNISSSRIFFWSAIFWSPSRQQNGTTAIPTEYLPNRNRSFWIIHFLAFPKYDIKRCRTEIPSFFTFFFQNTYLFVYKKWKISGKL